MLYSVSSLLLACIHIIYWGVRQYMYLSYTYTRSR